MDLKNRAIDGLKEMLEERMANRMRPKPEAKEANPPGESELPSGSEEEVPEVDAEPKLELEEGSEGGPSVDNLTPEEQETLNQLLEKAGC